MRKFPKKSKTELRQMNKALYTWLYRNDKDWLNKNSPGVVDRPTINNRVDWKERDEEILKQVKKAVAEIKQSNEKPKRITISYIGKIIGRLALLEKHLDKMPKTKEYLNSVAETVEDFQIRRIKWAIEELQKEDMPIMKSKLFRKAGINERYLQSINERFREVLTKKGISITNEGIEEDL